MKTSVTASGAPQAIGPYSQAVVHKGLVFLSGQIPLDPATGAVVPGDIAAQTERVFENLRAVLAEAGAGFDTVLKTTVFLANMDDFPRMNDVYASYFPSDPPARSTVEAARLPRSVAVEIDCIAYVRS